MGDNPTDMSAKIWRYMDIAKFASMLFEEALYFACPTEFDDPYEGYLPKSHIAAISVINQKFIDEQLAFRDQIVAANPDKDLREFHLKFNGGLNRYKEQSKNALVEASSKFGVNCWHKSEYESEAMWRLYSTYGIAIESTIGQLKASLLNPQGLHIENVRYADFENDPIEKGHKLYGLFMKRKSFEYEKELRATVLLDTPKKGALMKCDLNILVSRIHVSPLSQPYLKKVIENLCVGNLKNINKPIIQSPLYEKPDYAVNVNTNS